MQNVVSQAFHKRNLKKIRQDKRRCISMRRTHVATENSTKSDVKLHSWDILFLSGFCCSRLWDDVIFQWDKLRYLLPTIPIFSSRIEYMDVIFAGWLAVSLLRSLLL